MLCITISSLLHHGESRGAVNKKTAHCSANSAHRICFICSIQLLQSWNKAFFTVSMPKIPPPQNTIPKIKKIMGLVWAIWCAQKTPKDLPCRWAVLGAAGPVLDTKAKQKQPEKLLNLNLLNLLGAFCLWSYIHLPRVLLAYSPTFK